MNNSKKYINILKELAQHLPYSIFAVTSGIIFMGILMFISILTNSQELLPTASEELFHIFHPTHILFSAIATTSMFWKHEKNILKAIVVGFVGSIFICGISDIFFPFIGGAILGADIQLHVCIIEDPFLILPFCFFGILSGFFITTSIEHATQYSHSAHVFVSSAASILYMLSFGLADWGHLIGGVFIVTILAVLIPCCASDIVFPLTCVHQDCRH